MHKNNSKKSSFILWRWIFSIALVTTALHTPCYAKSGDKLSDKQVHSLLIQTAKYINANLPMMVDSGTRLDSTTALPGRAFMYSYTILGANKGTFDEQAFVRVMKPRLINSYKTLDEMKTFRNHNVELRYVYMDANGSRLVRIVITPADFN